MYKHINNKNLVKLYWIEYQPFCFPLCPNISELNQKTQLTINKITIAILIRQYSVHPCFQTVPHNLNMFPGGIFCNLSQHANKYLVYL